MIRRTACLWGMAVVCRLFYSSPGALEAQQLLVDLTLETFILVDQPAFKSHARAWLVDQQGQRIYEGQIILGHRVKNLTINMDVYDGEMVSEIGYATSNTGSRYSNYDQCYAAIMSAHANAYSEHESLNRSGVCTAASGGGEASLVDPPKQNSPVLLDLEQDGFQLSGPNPAVEFDINADGFAERIAWTKAGEDEAFLCLDRNGNGMIDDGSELFGYATPLLSGQRAKVGYRALAELDTQELGGNRDGKIDASDPMFGELCAWVDENRDAVSQPHEIYTLVQVGVVTLEYGYKKTSLRDSYGNLFRYVSRVEMRGPSGVVSEWPTYDVIFAEP